MRRHAGGAAHAPVGYVSTVKLQRPRRILERGGFRVVPGGGQRREDELTDAELIDAFEYGDRKGA
jgi:hypothetical protein